MRRFAWLFFAALGTVLLPVVRMPATSIQVAPAMSCCGPESTCAQHHASSPCEESPARECPACLPCASAAHAALLPASELTIAVLTPIAGLPILVAKGLSRTEPPPLPPPRDVA